MRAGDRRRLERLCRYVLRPPLAPDALELTAAGQVVLRLRRPWRDGTRAIRFAPSELLEKLAALVPRPRAHLLLYHGAFAARGCWRVARATAAPPAPPAPPSPAPEPADSPAPAAVPHGSPAARYVKSPAHTDYAHWPAAHRGVRISVLATQGLVVAGDQHLGKALTVRAAPDCKLHRGQYGASFNSPAEKARRAKADEKQRQEAKLRRRIFSAVHTAAPGRLGRVEFDELIAGYIDEMQRDSIKEFAQVVGVEATKTKHEYGSSIDWRGPLKKWIGTLDEAGVARVLVLLPLVPGLEGRDWMPSGRKGLLNKAAARYGVDVKAIERKLAAEAKARAAKKAARAKASAKKPAARRAGKAKKAAAA